MPSEDFLPARLYEKMDNLDQRVEAELKSASEDLQHYIREIQQAHAELSDAIVRLREIAPDIAPDMQTTLSYAKAMLCLLEMLLTSFIPSLGHHAKRGARMRAKFRKTGQETTEKRRGKLAAKRAYWNTIAQRLQSTRTSERPMSGRYLAKRIRNHCVQHKPEYLASIETIRKHLTSPSR